ncbi:GNAT family N-acetyltransferase [Aneurinibacillus sp. REN35]|uniref:GNAT family N-acetyltransferase n=1 Tax=Aneurinibacillus sp. REN35 TaxID=3237286 RepID=UPI003528D6C0
MSEFLTNKNRSVVIRKAQEEDAEGIIRYLNVVAGESDFLTFGAGEFTVSIEEERRFISSTSSQSNSLILVAVSEDDRIVGMLTFFGGARKRTEHVGEAGASVLKEYWGEGIGTALMNVFMDWARNTGVVQKINGRTRTDNKTSIRLCEKFGFVQEGLSKREFQINGQFYDFILFGLEINGM